MKKKYVTPSIEIEIINEVDIVTASFQNFMVSWLDGFDLDLGE